MKKNNLLLMAAASMLVASSCSNEEAVVAPGSGEGNVNFTISLPGNSFGTRSFADGLTADKLQIAVYDAENENLVTTKEDVTFGNSLQTTVSLNLASGRGYKIAFFAQSGAEGVYTFSASEKKVTVDYSKMTYYNSSDKYDCFYKLETIETVNGPVNKTVTLTRPVAQINWGTNDLADAAVTATDAYGAGAANLVTKVTTKAYTTFNLLDSDVDASSLVDVDIVFPYAARPAATEAFPVAGYDYVSMQYLLVPAANSVLDLKLEAANNATATTAMSTVNVTNAPVQANYRTNIYGALLTNPASITVNKDKEFAGDDNNVEVKIVRTAEELAEELTNGGSIEVPEGVELNLQNVNNGEEIELAPNTILKVNGTINTSRAQLSVTEGTVTVDGEGIGKITSIGVAEAKGNRPLNVSNGATLIVKNIELETEQNNGGSVIYGEDGNIDLDNVKVTCHNFAIGASGGTLIAKNCEFNSDSNNKVGAYSYTVNVQSGCKAVLDECTVNGVQGGVSVGNEGSMVTINGGTYSTHLYNNTPGTAFYPVYIFDKGVAIINGGDFISGCEYTIYNGNNDVPDLYTWGNGACLKGGRYNKGTLNQENKLTYPAAEGYEWKAIEGDDVFKWEVVKSATTEP